MRSTYVVIAAIAAVCAAGVAVALLTMSGERSKESNASSAAEIQRHKGEDAEAKSVTRNAVSYLESCFANNGSYAPCAPSGNAIEGQETGLDLSSTKVTVEETAYTVATTSKSGNEFTIEKTAAGPLERTCSTAGEAGCAANGSW
jgi:hypothetical protein